MANVISKIKLPNEITYDIHGFDEGAVRFDEEQQLAEDQKSRARENIDAVSSTQLAALKTEVKSEILGSAPEELNTLEELANALGTDENFSTTVLNQIGKKIETIEDGDQITVIPIETETGEKAVQINHKKYDLNYIDNEPVILKHGDNFTIQSVELDSGHVERIQKQTIILPSITEEDIIQKQGDWEDNDIESKSYIQNRTHYKYFGENDLIVDYPIENMEITFNYGQWTLEGYEFTSGAPNLLVKWDDKSYTVSANENQIYETEDFRISFFPAGMDLYAIKDEELETSVHTVSIHTLTESYKTLDKEYLPEGLLKYDTIQTLTEEEKALVRQNIGAAAIGGGSGGDTPASFTPDWAENNKQSANYIKNRTHWVEEGKEILLTEQTVSTDDAYINDMRNYDFLGLTEIIVLIDGTEYKCPFWETFILDGIEIQNVFCSENSPFYFEVVYGEDLTLGLDPNYPTASEFVWQFHVKPSYADSFGGTHLVQIEKLTDELNYHTIDEKYIPEKFHNKQDKIKYGTSLPSSAKSGDICLMLDEEVFSAAEEVGF